MGAILSGGLFIRRLFCLGVIFIDGNYARYMDSKRVY